MKRFLLAALAAAALGSSTGCCRGWFIWPGHYPHNPSFSQCCEPPWAPDPFRREGGREQGWGRGPHAASEARQDCCYGSCGLCDFFRDEPPARGPYGAPGMPGMYGPQGAPDAMSAAQVAYPYYTNRGPRDFLMGYPPGTQPPSIGP